MRVHTLFILPIVAAIACACQSRPRDLQGQATVSGPATAITEVAEQGKPAAYVNGIALTREQLYPRLIEHGGGELLLEIVLQQAVAQRLSDAKVTLTTEEINDERQRLLNTMSADADEAAGLLTQMRLRRGLGDLRFNALLHRNAGLRALVQDDLAVSDLAIKQAYERRYGKRYRARLITSPSIDAIGKAKQRAIAGERFAELAVELSTDASAAQGGLLSPISPADASYPKAIRDALPKLAMDDVASRLSPAIALANSYALLYLETVVEPDAPEFAAVREELAVGVRLELERVRMQQLARAILEEANVIVLDAALDLSWQHQRRTLIDLQ